MQLKLATLALVAVLALTGAAQAQSLSPMRNLGMTPSDVKGFKLVVGNPYDTRMTFTVTPMDPAFKVSVADAVVSAPEIRLAPGASRPIIVKFKIDPALKERTIGVCVQPRDLDGPILPRVCGTYTGRRLSAGG
jgi:hypothetical protein